MHSLHAVQHEFERRIRNVHNHLYANANVRTNDAIATEVAKILLAMMNASKDGSLQLVRLSKAEKHAVVRGGGGAGDLAAQVQEHFARMNAHTRKFARGTRIELDDASIAYVRTELDGVLFADVARDWLGDAMEVFRSLDAKRLGGQFFTDQRITDLSISLLEFDPEAGDDFVDICAGTAGFLLAAARRLQADYPGADAQTIIRGIEVDPQLALVANGSLVTQLDRAEYVSVADSLANPSSWDPTVRRRVIPGTHRCLASNPPFGTKITIKDDRVLAQYQLAARWRKVAEGWTTGGNGRSPRPPDILFIERNLQLAEPGRGRVALVTPYQVLSGPQLGYVREWILRNARVQAIVDLPAETFQPWTGTKTALMVLERRKEPLDRWQPDEADYDVFMAVAEHIGHDRRGNPVVDDFGRIRTDLPAIAEAFQAFRLGQDPSSHHTQAYVVSASSFTSATDLRLNAAYYRPSRLDLRAQITSLASPKWHVSTVGELTERIFFPTRFKRHYVAATEPGAIPFLGGAQIAQLVPRSDKYLAANCRQLADLVVEPGWILVTRSGSTGIVSSVPASWSGMAMSEHVIRIVPNSTQVDPLYLEAYLRSPIGQELLAAGIFGSVIDEITPEHVASIPVPIPKNPKRMRSLMETLQRASSAREEAGRSLVAGVDRLSHLICNELE